MQQTLRLLSAGLLLMTSCQLSAPPDHRKPAPPRCAILLSESNLELCRSQSWTEGPDTYTGVVLGLQNALSARGLDVDAVSEDDLVWDRLTEYRVLYIVETFSITRDAEKAIRRFVENGGVLVGINEVGRFQSSWCKPWHYEDIFGVKSGELDEYGTALSWSTNLYRRAEITPEGKRHPLTRGLGDTLEFGAESAAIWATRPTTATVLAWFPRHTAKTRDSDHRTHVVEEPVVAVSLNRFGKGNAVWISANLHARDPSNWTKAGDIVDLLARCRDLAPADLTIPPRPVETILGISQLGYAPDEKKRAVIRVPLENATPFTHAHFTITAESSGDVILSGELLQEGPDNAWRDYYYIADFTSLRDEGTYRFSAALDGPRGTAQIRSGPFRIAAGLWSSVVMPTQWSFFRHYRCGEKCHLSDPVRGAYHDATGDYATRMWSMPHVVYGISENILASSGIHTDAVAELQYAVDWMLAMIHTNGAVWSSVKPPDEWSPINTRPAQDPTQRVLDEAFSLNYQTTYIAGLAHAARALKTIDPDRSARALATAINARHFLDAKDWANESTAEVGNFIWALMELHEATGEADYLKRAAVLAPITLARQFLDSARTKEGLYGDFFDDPKNTAFGNRQYKKFHALGVYLGLVELAGALPSHDPIRTNIHKALDAYFDHHALRGAALTPYRQMITALEETPGGTYRIFFFTHMGCWVHLHGLNVDHLCLALAALKYADMTGREDARDFARAQTQWVVGMNPLGYSMIEAVGWTHAPSIDDNIGTGRFEGGIFNGIVGDYSDRPTWGDTWDSREYWLPHNAYLAAVAPHLDREPGRQP